MKASITCVNLAKSFEGFKTHPYLDSVGVPTIGYGTTYYLDGTKVTMHDPDVTEDQACHLLLAKLGTFSDQVVKMVSVPINQNQLDALTDFAYNVGPGALHSSTLLKLLNAGDVSGAADQFLVWNKAGGVAVAGLTRRREAERSLFLQSVPANPPTQGANDYLSALLANADKDLG